MFTARSRCSPRQNGDSGERAMYHSQWGGKLAWWKPRLAGKGAKQKQQWREPSVRNHFAITHRSPCYQVRTAQFRMSQSTPLMLLVSWMDGSSWLKMSDYYCSSVLFHVGPDLLQCHVEGTRVLKLKRRRAIFCTYYVKMKCFCIFNLYCQLVDCLEMLTTDSDMLRMYDEWWCDAVPNFFWLK